MDNSNIQKDTSTIFQLMKQYDSYELRIAEDNIPAQWKIGDEYLGLYEVKELLGKGGMGQVHKVRHKIWQMDVAVKSPLEKIINTESGIGNFVNEANTWVELGLHPNIVSCYYIRVLGKVPRIFVEYVDGGNLKEWILEGKLYEGSAQKVLERILDIAIQSARGIGYAHKQNIVHKDIKPANIMLSNDGLVKLTDFGMASLKQMLISGETFRSDGQSIYVGNEGFTPEYCSPEQGAGGSVSRMTDIWSWALTVLEMFIGERTWNSGIAAELALEDYIKNNYKITDSSIPNMPAPLEILLNKCLQKNVGDRLQNITIIEAELLQIYQNIIGNEYSRIKINEVELKADELNNRAVSYLDLGREDKAVAYWKEAIKFNNQHLESIYNYGYYRWVKAEITDDDLLMQIGALESLFKNYPYYWQLLGWIHYERGDNYAIEEIQNSKNRINDEIFIKALKNKDRPIGEEIRKFEFDGGGRYDLAWYHDPICFSPDGRFVLSCGYDKKVHLWEVQTGKEVRSFIGHTSQIMSACFSPSGNYALTGSWDDATRLWEIQTGREIKKFDVNTKNIKCVCFSPDERYVITVSNNSIISLWDINTENEIRKFEKHTGNVKSVCFSPDGKFVLSGGGTIILWEVQTGREIKRFGEKNESASVCFSPDGRYALSGGVNLMLIDVILGKIIRIYKGFNKYFTSVCFSSDGRFALSGSTSNKFQLWNIASGKCIRTFRISSDIIWDVSFSRDGHLALSRWSDVEISVWKVLFPEINIKHSFPLLNKVKTPNAIVADDAIIKNELIKLENLIKEKNYIKGYKLIQELQKKLNFKIHPELLNLKNICCVNTGFKRIILKNGWCSKILMHNSISSNNICLSNNGQLILSAGSLDLSESEDKGILLWEVNDEATTARDFYGHNADISSACFSPDGKYALSGCGLTPVCFSPDGKFALSGSDFITVRLWDIETRKEIKRFGINYKSIYSEYLSHSNTYNLIMAEGEYIILWDIRTGSEIRRFSKFHSTVCFSPDGNYILATEGIKIQLLDLNTGKEIIMLEGHTRNIDSICFSPNGKYVLSGSRDNTIRLWDINTGDTIVKFEGHTDCVPSVCFSPNGRYVLSGSLDKTVRLWDIMNGAELGRFEGHNEPVESVCFSPDGSFALSGSYDKTIRLWKFDWDWEYVEPTDWDEDARPFLDIFLELHRSYGPNDISRIGIPIWNNDDFIKFYDELKNKGFGYIRPDGIRKELEKMTRDWNEKYNNDLYI